MAATSTAIPSWFCAAVSGGRSPSTAATASVWLPARPSSSRFGAPVAASFVSVSPPRRMTAARVSAAEAPTESEAARRLYVGNIPRTVTNEELERLFSDHGAVEKAEVMYDKYSGRSRRFGFVTMSTIEGVESAIQNLNDTEVGGRKIKVNVTEKPLVSSNDFSLLQSEDSRFIDSPYKVYVGNLAKTVTADVLIKFFSEKGKALSAKVSRDTGTSKSKGFGFVTFSSEEDVEAAIASFNNQVLEGQKIRVNKV